MVRFGKSGGASLREPGKRGYIDVRSKAILGDRTIEFPNVVRFTIQDVFPTLTLFGIIDFYDRTS